VEKISIVTIYDTDPGGVEIEFYPEYDEFVDLFIDGVLQTRGIDYSVRPGSTVVTVFGQTLAELDPQNDHVIAAEFKDENGNQYSVAQIFRIRVVSPPPSPTPRPSNSTNDPVVIPSVTPPAVEPPPPIPPLPPRPDYPTKIIIYATVSLDATGRIANATVSDDEVLDAAGKVVIAATEAGTESAIEIRIEAPPSADEYNLELSDISMNALTDNGVDALIVNSPQLGTMTIADAIISTMNSARGGEKIGIDFRHLTDPSKTLNERQLLSLGDDTAFEIAVQTGSGSLSELGGTMNVDIPYTLKSGQGAGNVYVYYLFEEGGKTVMPSKYLENERMVTFDTTHLSVYAINSPPSMPYTGGTDMTLWMLMLGVFLMLSGLALCRKRESGDTA